MIGKLKDRITPPEGSQADSSTSESKANRLKKSWRWGSQGWEAKSPRPEDARRVFAYARQQRSLPSTYVP